MNLPSPQSNCIAKKYYYNTIAIVILLTFQYCSHQVLCIGNAILLVSIAKSRENTL